MALHLFKSLATFELEDEDFRAAAVLDDGPSDHCAIDGRGTDAETGVTAGDQYVCKMDAVPFVFAAD